MNGRKILLEVMNGIDDDLILRTEKYFLTEKNNAKKKNREMKWLFACVSVLLVITIGTAIVTLFVLPNIRDRENILTSTDTDYTLRTTNPDVDMSAVLYCSDSSGKIMDESVPGPGRIKMPMSLSDEILKPENKDKYFSVSIDFLYFDCVENYREAMHEKYMDTVNDPAIMLYQSEYEKWLETIVKPTIPKDRLEQYEEKVFHTPKSYEQFEEEYWKINQSEDTQKAYIEAEQRRLKAWNEYLDFSIDSYQILYQNFSKDVEIEINAELERLQKLGYKLELTDKINYYQGFECGRLTGYLTGEQLSGFACNPKHGYYIVWNDHEGVGDE